MNNAMTNSSGVIATLNSSDCPIHHIQGAGFAYYKGTFYCAYFAVASTGNIACARFTPSGTSVSDANIAYYMSASWVVA